MSTDGNEKEMEMLKYMWTRTWWTFAILGLIAVALGIFALLNPKATATMPIQLMGVFIVLDGLFKIVTAVIEHRHNWTTRLAGGAVEIIIGAIIFALALEIVTVAFTFILYLAGIGFLIAGGVSIMQTLQGRREWPALLTGALKLGFGVLLFALTGPIAISLVWITGIFMFGMGALLLFMGFRMRQMGRQLGPRVRGNVVEGQVIDGEVVEDDAEIEQLPDHFE